MDTTPVNTEMNSFDALWSNFYLNFSEEKIIANIHLIETLEHQSPYKGTHTSSYFSRVTRALEMLPGEHRESALLIFGSVLYFPQLMMDTLWRFLWNEVEYDTKSIQFFEVDQVGINHFAHVNHLEGRLDTDTFVRVCNVNELLTLFIALDNTRSEIKTDARDRLKALAGKRRWYILTDKVLSGQSLANDLNRYIRAANILQQAFDSEIEIYVMAQIITNDAVTYIEKICNLQSRSNVTILSGLALDSVLKLNSSNCILIRNSKLLESVRSTCEWFSETYLALDPELLRMREKSGDNLAYGYRGCGLTFTDWSNCPTNSIPLLWYDSSAGRRRGAQIPLYIGPFPRTHSRRGDQTTPTPSNYWDKIDDAQTINKLKIHENH